MHQRVHLSSKRPPMRLSFVRAFFAGAAERWNSANPVGGCFASGLTTDAWASDAASAGVAEQCGRHLRRGKPVALADSWSDFGRFCSKFVDRVTF